MLSLKTRVAALAHRFRRGKISMPPEKFSPVGARDVFLVTYPRSGTTWISCIAAELQFHRAPKNLTEIASIVPHVHDLPAKSAVADADRRNCRGHASSPCGSAKRMREKENDPKFNYIGAAKAGSWKQVYRRTTLMLF